MNSLVAIPLAGLPTVTPSFAGTLDRRAPEAYASWLFMERRILCGELWPDEGAKAERYDWNDNAGSGWHLRGRGDLAWNEGPQPSSRAATILDLVGVDWRQPKRDMGLNHEDSGKRPPLPARWPEVDGELTAAYEEIVSLDAKIEEYCTTISDEDRETHQGFWDAENARSAAIVRLGEIPAQSLRG
jgi:hypothetical protein